MTAGRNNQTDDWGLEDSTPATWRARSTRLTALLLCLVPLASPSLVRAEDLAEEEELPVDEGFNLANSTFDQWIFGEQLQDNGVTRLESQLALNVDSIIRDCGLTSDQAAKLELAGRGDIKRFDDEVDKLFAKFVKVRRNRNAVNEFYQEILPVKAKFDAGLFNETSLFGKVLSRTLNDEQAAKHEQAERERRQFRYHAKLSLVVAIIERTMPLRDEQRERLIQVFKEETQPPKAFGQYDYYVALYQLSRVPDEKLEPIFDEPQWKVFVQFKAQGQAMHVFLQQQGLLP